MFANRLGNTVLKLDDFEEDDVVICCCCCALFISSRTFLRIWLGEVGDEAPDEVNDDGDEVVEFEASDADEEHECWPGEVILFDEFSTREPYVFIKVGFV